jgi:hypothetical protein
MATRTKPQTTQKEDGSILVTVGKASYTFREPLGKDLSAVERYLNSSEDATETEKMAFLCSRLAIGLEATPETFLELPVSQFRYLSEQINNFFRTLDDKTV